MKKEKLQWIPQKYKESLETTTSNYVPINGQSRRNGQILRKMQSSNIEPGRTRNCEQTNHKY